jgi:hypothetical protein
LTSRSAFPLSNAHESNAYSRPGQAIASNIWRLTSLAAFVALATTTAAPLCLLDRAGVGVAAPAAFDFDFFDVGVVGTTWLGFARFARSRSSISALCAAFACSYAAIAAACSTRRTAMIDSSAMCRNAGGFLGRSGADGERLPFAMPAPRAGVQKARGVEKARASFSD